LKTLPICYHGQASVIAALGLRERLRIEAIKEIQIDTYDIAVMMMGADPGRWAPATRETADHSLPYCVAVALLDGEVSAKSFAEERLHDPKVGALMKKIKVRDDAGLTAKYPQAVPGRVEITMTSGELLSAEVEYPTGHAMNPMSDAEVETKFRSMFAGRASAGQCDSLLKALWSSEKIENFGREVTDRLTLPA
ncbi:MAG: prpD, partial [Betaproteobacteria bacterium]|nr:prpD [Betaproteobacteria bacterium]